MSIGYHHHLFSAESSDLVGREIFRFFKEMRTSSSPSTPAASPANQLTASSVITLASTDVHPAPGGNTVSWHELRSLVLPLPAFLTTNSHDALLDPQAIYQGRDPHPRRGEVRLCYRLNPRFFHEETSLDEPLVALLRANHRGRGSHRWPLRVATELTFNSERSHGPAWSALVISSPHEIEREDCVNHVNRLLRVILRPGYIQPLTCEERALLGRVPAQSRR